MLTKFSSFKYIPQRLLSEQDGFIELRSDDNPVIQNIKEFYKFFGYSQVMANNGILPDEFIWEKYVCSNKSKFNHCIQKHIIEYLLKNSFTFKEKYGAQCENWLVEHANARAVSRKFCIACRMKSFCSTT